MGFEPDLVDLSTLSRRDVKFKDRKIAAQQVANLFGLEGNDGLKGFIYGNKNPRVILYSGYEHKINGCGNWLNFAQYPDGTLKLKDARFCKTPFCPMCQWRRTLVWRAKFFSQMPEIQKMYPNHRWVFLTLTLRNCEIQELRSTVTHMGKSFNRMRELADFPLLGWIRSLEVTRAWDWYDANGNFLGRHGVTWWYRSKDPDRFFWSAAPTDEVHPHYHLLALVNPSYFSGSSYVSHDRWVEMWSQSLRVDYPAIVNIKTVKPKKGQSLLPDPEAIANATSSDQVKDPSGIFTAILETMKYTVKEDDMIGRFCQDEQVNSSWLKQMTEQMYKMRRIEYGGILKPFGKGIAEEESKNESLIKGGESEESLEKAQRELIFHWNRGLKNYVTLIAREEANIEIESM